MESECHVFESYFYEVNVINGKTVKRIVYYMESQISKFLKAGDTFQTRPNFFGLPENEM